MIRNDINNLGKPLFILNPGDYMATKDDCILGTVIGACVVVCLYDVARRIGGMGHFIVPGSLNTRGIVNDDIAQHGIVNLEYLMGELVKLGGDRRFMRAKVFGAGYLESKGALATSIVDSNIRFIYEYFSLEQIVVDRSDLGGEFRRKIYFYPLTGYVYRKILQHNEETSEFIKLEKEYIDQAFRDKERHGRVLIFD
jgi:chemotaxis protein CheD